MLRFYPSLRTLTLYAPDDPAEPERDGTPDAVLGLARELLLPLLVTNQFPREFMAVAQFLTLADVPEVVEIHPVVTVRLAIGRDRLLLERLQRAL